MLYYPNHALLSQPCSIILTMLYYPQLLYYTTSTWKKKRLTSGITSRASLQSMTLYAKTAKWARVTRWQCTLMYKAVASWCDSARRAEIMHGQAWHSLPGTPARLPTAKRTYSQEKTPSSWPGLHTQMPHVQNSKIRGFQFSSCSMTHEIRENITPRNLPTYTVAIMNRFRVQYAARRK